MYQLANIRLIFNQLSDSSWRVMTRINVIPVQFLTDQHLIAEYRELPRIVHGVLCGNSLSLKGMPDKYVLGKGHVIFFRNKLHYLNQRHQQIVYEAQQRQFKLRFVGELLQQYDLAQQKYYQHYIGEWQPDLAAQRLNIERLLKRIAEGKRGYHWKRNPLSYLDYLSLLQDNLPELFIFANIRRFT